MADIMTVKEHIGRYEDIKVGRGRDTPSSACRALGFVVGAA